MEEQVIKLAVTKCELLTNVVIVSLSDANQVATSRLVRTLAGGKNLLNNVLGALHPTLCKMKPTMKPTFLMEALYKLGLCATPVLRVGVIAAAGVKDLHMVPVARWNAKVK
jgi:hypothetical protein